MTTTSTPPTGQVQWCHGLGCFATLPELKPGWVQAAGWWWCPEHSEDGRRMAAAGCDVCPMADGTHAGQCERAASDARQRPPPTPPASLPLSPWTGPLTPGQVDYARKLAEHTLKTEGGPGLGTAERYLVARWAVELAGLPGQDAREAHLQAAADVLDCGVYEVAAAARGLLTLSWALVEKGVRKVDVRQSVAESLWTERLRLRGELADARQQGHEVTQALLALTHPHTGHLMHEEGACTGECREVRRVLKLEGVEDIPVGVVVPATLSSAPEDVARDHKEVLAAIDSCEVVRTGTRYALSRLATAAARVPGLEAEVKRLEARADERREHLLDLQSAISTAESERDAYKRDLQAEMDGAGSLRQRLGAREEESFPSFVDRLASERDAARAQVAKLELDVSGHVGVIHEKVEHIHALQAERDAARREVETLTKQANDAVAEMDRADRERDAARKGLSAAMDAVSALTARVAELERENAPKGNDLTALRAALASIFPGVSFQWSALSSMLLALDVQRGDAEARATAAKAKVQKLAAALRYARTWAPEGGATLAEVDAALSDAPAPTPAPGEPCDRFIEYPAGSYLMCDVRGPHESHGGTEPNGPRKTWRDPAPGLREAVGPLVEQVKEWDAVHVLPDNFPAQIRLMLGAARRIVAAYDATTEPVVTHAQLAAAVEAYAKDKAKQALSPHTKKKERPVLHGCAIGAREVLRRVTGGEVPEVSEWKEKAAKWDAAVERTKDEDAAACALLGIPTFKGSGMPPSHKSSWRTKAQTFARWLLGLTLPTGPKEKNGACEDCKHPMDIHFDNGCEKCGCGEPTGPGGGETNAEAVPPRSDGRPHLPPGRFYTDDEGPRPDPDAHWCKGECGELTFNKPGDHEAWHRARGDNGFTPRARIAPTPTSEGPALVWCEDNDHHWDTKDGDLPSDGRQEAKCTRCPAVATRARVDRHLYRIPSKPAQAEPAAPEVEWQWRDESGNSANVTTHGHLHSHGDIWEVAHALARSLVEEKRRLKLVQEAHAGAYLVLDRVEAEERGRWKPVLDALGEALGVAPPTTAPSINRDAALALEVVRGRAASRLLHWLGAPVDGVLGVEGRRVRDFAEGTPIPDAVRGVLEEESRQTERLLAQLQSLVGSISKAAEVEDWGRALLVALAASLPGRHAWGQEVLVEWKSLDAPVRGALRLAAATLLRKAKQGGEGPSRG